MSSFRGKRISKIIAAAACVALVAGLLPASAAAEPVQSDGALPESASPTLTSAPLQVATTREAGVEAISGNGTQGSPFEVNTADDFQKVIDDWNNSAGIVYIKLGNNITDAPQIVFKGRSVDLNLNGSNIASSADYAFNLDEQGAGQLTLRGSGEISCNTLVSVHEGSTFTMESGTISSTNNCVYVNGGTFTMNGGTLKKENSSGKGVRIYAGSFTMNGGTVSSVNGYGVSVEGSGSFEMYGGTVSSVNEYGVHIHSTEGGSFTMNGGMVSSESRSGVYVGKGSFTMNGGTVSSESGSGVYVVSGNGGSFTISCGTVVGGEYSVWGEVKNPSVGVGWTDIAGKEGRTDIAPSPIEARHYDNYKRIAFPVYDVAASASSAGNGTVSGGGKYAYGETVTMKAAADAGYHFANWTEGGTVVSTDVSYAFEVAEDRALVANFEKDAPAPKGEYACGEGSGSTWTKGSPDPLTFRFKGAGDDKSTFKYFKGVEVDGNPVPQEDSSGKPNWRASEGSVILSLQPSFLETLSVGDHTVKALFTDGSAQATFTVKAAPAASTTNTIDNATGTSSKSGLPDTSDKLPIAPFAATTLLSLAAVLVSRTKLQPAHAARHGKHAR